MGFSKWKIAAGVSLSIHLLFIFTVSILFSGTDADRSPIHYVKISLHPFEEEEKLASDVIDGNRVNDRVERPKEKELLQAERDKKPSPKKEIELPVPLPVQAVSKEIPVDDPEQSSPPPGKQEEITEPVPLTRVAGLVSDLTPKTEEPTSFPTALTASGGVQGNSRPDPLSVEKAPGSGPEGLAGEPHDTGLGGGKGGLSSKAIGEGPQGTQKRFYSEGSGNGGGVGPGRGSGQGDSPGEGSRKGGGFFAKLFPPSGGVGGGTPRYAENPKPPYPKEARDRGHQGEVLLRIEVLANGRVGQIEVKRSSGYESLDQSALSTVKQWKFIPAKRGEDPIAFWVNIPIKFKLQ